MLRSHRSSAWIRVALFVALAVASVRGLYRSAYEASALRVTPDEVEYALGAERFVRLGTFDLDFDGTRLPPSSSPWFSIGVLAPAYVVAPHQIGAGIYSVLALSLFGLLVLYSLGARFGGAWGGSFAVLGVLVFGAYPSMAQYIMTDVPSAAFALGALWFFVRASEGNARSFEWWFAGAAIAAAFALRSVYLALLPQFLWLAWSTSIGRMRAILAATLPTLAVVVATWIYQARAFGDWSRSGYQFWRSVPYDYPSLVWSTDYFAANFAIFAESTTALGFGGFVVGATLLLLKRDRGARRFVLACALVVAPITFFFLGYYYPDTRMHMLGQTLGFGLAAAGVGAWLPPRVREFDWVPLVLAVAVACFVERDYSRSNARREVVDEIAARTPNDALILSLNEAVYLEAFEPEGSARTFLALCRDVEFASKLLTPVRVPAPEPPPRDAYDYRCAGLRRGGARDAVRFTASERPDLIQSALRSGRRVFLDRSPLTDVAIADQLLGRHLRYRGRRPQDSLIEVVAVE
ncbi:MAG: hypothetical protein K8S98_07590 [Planctomycetes bacterium]|nr:hypothetical protein [Planctomycetota bacterium]